MPVWRFRVLKGLKAEQVRSALQAGVRLAAQQFRKTINSCGNGNHWYAYSSCRRYVGRRITHHVNPGIRSQSACGLFHSVTKNVSAEFQRIRESRATFTVSVRGFLLFALTQR